MEQNKKLFNKIQFSIFEALMTQHVEDRLLQRMLGGNLVIPKFPTLLYTKVEKMIDFLKNNLDFDLKEAFYISLLKLPTQFKEFDKYGNLKSHGDTVCAIIRDNSIITIFFRNSNQRQKEEYENYTFSELEMVYNIKKKRPGEKVQISKRNKVFNESCSHI